MTTYADFLKAKIRMAKRNGLPCGMDEINPLLMGFQRDIVQWAIEGGQRGIFADFGLGKSFMQLEICRIMRGKAGGRSLIVCPLGVRQEFFRDAGKLDVPLRFVQRSGEVGELGENGHYITNYESIREGKLDPNLFSIVTLDEASVLRSYGSKTYQEFLPLFADIPYKFVATATPSPNKDKELIHYAGFLGIMDTGQALTRFFIRNSETAGDLQLNPHKEDEFWTWLHSWAIFLQKPSELGYSDEGYVLPELEVIYHEVPSLATQQVDRDGQVLLFNDSAMSLSEASREKRGSIDARIAKMMEIVEGNPENNHLLWHDLESERKAIEKALPSVVSVYGSLDLEVREQRIIDFSDGKIQYLATKPQISGSGCNFQRHCHDAVYLGIGFKFNDFIQSIHRIHRFLQTERCVIHIIHTDAERTVLATLRRKWEEHKRLREKMSEIVKKYGLNKLSTDPLERTIGVERRVAKGKRYEVANNDCVEEVRLKAESSIDLIITSIPFSNHYEYTPSYNDFGHTDDNAHFWAQMDYLSPEMLRILRPGRLACIHVKDRILFGSVTGAGVPTVSPFHAEAIFHYIKHGFDYMGMITVVTDVVRENNQTYRLGWTEQCRDGTKMGVGSPEYVLLFRKPQTDRSRGFADTPVKKDKTEYSRPRWQVDAHAFWRSSGNTLIRLEDVGNKFRERSREVVYNYEGHVALGEHLDETLPKGLPSTFMAIAPGSHDPAVWDDVTRMRTLNSSQAQKGLQAHICPLQFDIVDRLIQRYSNEDELVYDPFAGLMTVPYRAILLGRRGGGSELSAQSFDDGVGYLEAAERDELAPTLFDCIEDEAI